MNDGQLRERMRERNPWWRSAEGDRLAWVQSDTTLAGVSRYDIGHRSNVLDDVAPDGLYVLRGPRRVGKSVTLKRLIVSLLSKGVAPLRIIYLSVDDFTTQDLRRALVQGRKITESVGDEPRYWLIDEVTSVANWTRVIKEARDNTDLARDAVVLTGSSISDLAASERDLSAGRAGTSTENRFRLQLPLTFREFVSAVYPEVPLPEMMTPDLLQSREAAEASSALVPWIGELDLHWQSYLECGGFPRAVAEYTRDGAVGRSFCRDLHAWLASDLTSGDQEDAVQRILAEITARLGSPFQLVKFGESVGLGRTAAATRIARLKANVALITCQLVDDSGQPKPNSQPKQYLVDPILARLPLLLEPGFHAPDATKLTEMVLAITIARAIDAIHPGRLLEGRAVGFIRTSSGNEVDFAPVPIRVGGADTSTVPMESKWVNQGWRREALVIEGKYQRGIVATKDILDTEGHPVWAIPAPVVALLLG